MKGPSGRKEEPLAEKASARPFLEIKRTYHFKLTKSGGSTQIIHSDAHERSVRSEGATVEVLGALFRVEQLLSVSVFRIRVLPQV